MFAQPPSGGCVLKPDCDPMEYQKLGPAAFRRLCVETNVFTGRRFKPIQPPSGGCVLKLETSTGLRSASTPAAFRRLCVETRD